MTVRDSKFTVWTISKAWEKSRLNFFNPDIFSDADFAPSKVSSTSAHLPSSYPIDETGLPTEDAQDGHEIMCEVCHDCQRSNPGTGPSSRPDNGPMDNCNPTDNNRCAEALNAKTTTVPPISHCTNCQHSQQSSTSESASANHQNQDLEAEVEQLKSQSCRAVAHCMLAHDKINKLQVQINTKNS